MRRLLLPLAFGLLGGLTGAQSVGTQMPPFQLQDFALTKATSLDDYLGRAVLFEFFAHW